MIKTEKEISRLIDDFCESHLGPGAYHPVWEEYGREGEISREDLVKQIMELMNDKDKVIHDMGLDIARLQGCHVDDSDYQQGSTVF